ncbi:MAG: type II secretion system F family protein [Helicobacter sp.]|nr:type II secretion system F family protein [Helicobacter sp.]
MKFKVKFLQNKSIKSKIFDALSEDELKAQLKSQNIAFLEITAHKNAAFSLPWRKKANLKDISLCFKQLSMLLGGNMPLLAIITHIKSNAKGKMAEIFDEILKRLSSGQNLAKSFSAFGNNLSKMHHGLIKIAQDSGKLEEIFAKISLDLENKIAYQKKLKKALFYPATVLITMIFAFLIAVILIIPEFKSFFGELDADLPLVTTSLIFLDSFLRNFGLIFIAALIILAFISKRAYDTKDSFRLKIDQFLLKIPFFGKLILFHSNFRYFEALFLLQSSGLNIENSLNLASDLLQNKALQNEASTILQKLKAGKNMEEAILDLGFLDDIALVMLKSGIKSGNFDDALIQTANHYKVMNDDMLDKSLLYLEPLLNIFMALLVLYLALGIFLPIWSINSSALS